MFEKLVFSLDDMLYQEFKKAIQTGYWGNGVSISHQQKKICQEVIILRENAATTSTHLH